jgi:hypothetical protein
MPHGMKKQAVLFMFVNLLIDSALGQTVSIGVKGGIQFVDQTQPESESRPYLVGPSVEVRLPANFAVEADALYQRIGNSSNFYFIPPGTFVSPPSIVSYTSRIRGNSWEFPVLAKYYFRPRSAGWQPFIATGWSMRTIGFENDINQTVVNASGAAQQVSAHNHYRSGLDIGAAFAAGVRLRAGRFAVVPEFRYVRWSSHNSLNRHNEASFLLGLSF